MGNNQPAYAIDVGDEVRAALELDLGLQRMRREKAELQEQMEITARLLKEEQEQVRLAREAVRKLIRQRAALKRHRQYVEKFSDQLKVMRHREKELIYNLTKRSTDINNAHRGVFLKNAYKQLGLPVPKKLMKLRPVVALKKINEKLEDTQNEMDGNAESG